LCAWVDQVDEVYQIDYQRNQLLDKLHQPHAQNVAVRSTPRVVEYKVPLKRNIILVFGVLSSQGIHILSMQIPFMQNILRIEPVAIQ